jgi:hypothetical protein
MVGVVAALCVVTLAAWRGQLWFHETHVACSAAPPSFEAPDDGAPAAIRKYLRAHFDEIDYRNGAIFMTGLTYLGAPLVEVRSEGLQRALPGTRFFTTKLANPNYLYLEVETLISFREGAEHDNIRSEHDDIRTLLSPVFGGQSRKFFQQFIGLSAPTPRDREEIVLGLTDLLAAITNTGVARPSPGLGERAQAELWRGELHLRDIAITSNRRGRVNQIVVRNPKDPQDVLLVSDFSASADP